MKRVFSVLVLLLAGCGVGFGPVTGRPIPGRVRVACQFFTDDRGIEALFFLVESDLEVGFTPEEITVAGLQGCEGSEFCRNCAIAVLLEILGP